MHRLQENHYTYLMVFAMLFWGGGWTALKILTYNLPMEVIIFWRFLIMSIAFIPFIYYFKIPFTFNAGALKFIAASSVLNMGFMVSSFYGIKYGLAGAGSVIITSVSPVMTFLLAALLFRKKIALIHYFGLFLGLLGGYILLQLSDLALFFNGANIYYIICATIWAGVTLLSQHSQKYIHPLYYSFIISLIATISTFIYAFDAELLAVFEQNTEFWIAMIYLGVFGQTVATTIFFLASGKLGSEKTSSFMFLVPVFALFFAWLFLDEEIQTHILIGGAVSMLAVYFINTRRKT
ncbi:MAG: DMT family transporter [Campylobacterales bacterium]|nr:DMT family transporter [Campylobacterales bacterium]